MKHKAQYPTPLAEQKLKIVYVKRSIPQPWDENPRVHTPTDVHRIVNSIKHFGFVNPMLLQKGTDRIIAGHGRLEAAEILGERTVPVIYLELNDQDAMAYTIADNALAELSQWDPELLPKHVKTLDEAGFDVNLTGLDLSDFDFTPEGELEDDEAPEPPKTPIVKLGDIFQLGPHRIMCGDAENEDHVKALLVDAEPILMVTDPPYGVDYDPSWRTKVMLGSIRSTGKVQNDDRADWRKAYELFPGDVAYVWHAGRESLVFQHSLEESGFEIVNQIIWGKKIFAIGRGDYHWQHEPCFYAVRKGKRHNWQGSRSETTLWMIGRETEEPRTGHGTQKPIECMAKPIRNNSSTREEVYDPFLGSGTTLIAAHKLGRICYGLELDPGYVEAIIKRFHDTCPGQEIRHVNGKITVDRILGQWPEDPSSFGSEVNEGKRASRRAATESARTGSPTRGSGLSQTDNALDAATRRSRRANPEEGAQLTRKRTIAPQIEQNAATRGAKQSKSIRNRARSKRASTVKVQSRMSPRSTATRRPKSHNSVPKSTKAVVGSSAATTPVRKRGNSTKVNIPGCA